MELEVRPAPIGARIVDSLPFSLGGSFPIAVGLAHAGCQGVAVYLGGCTKERVKAVLEAGMGCFGVTFGNTYDGVSSVRQAQVLGFPKGTSLFLDLEGKDDLAPNKTPEKLIQDITSWVEPVVKAGYMPCLYVGVPQPLTSEELHKLPVVRYWKGQGRQVDRYNKLSEPTNGWCMTQMYPSVPVAGVAVDWNMVGQDYKGRVPHLAYRKA